MPTRAPNGRFVSDAVASMIRSVIGAHPIGKAAELLDIDVQSVRDWRVSLGMPALELAVESDAGQVSAELAPLE